MGWEFLLLGFGCGLLNGLLGLPGPLRLGLVPSLAFGPRMMVYFASVMSAGRLDPKTCFILSQTFFLAARKPSLAPIVLEHRSFEDSERPNVALPGPKIMRDIESIKYLTVVYVVSNFKVRWPSDLHA